MIVYTFEWDESNVSHIRSHGVEPGEAEEALAYHPVIRRSRSGRYLALGRTAEGRRLTVVFERRSAGVVRVVTARPMSPAEARRFRRSGR